MWGRTLFEKIESFDQIKISSTGKHLVMGFSSSLSDHQNNNSIGIVGEKYQDDDHRTTPYYSPASSSDVSTVGSESESESDDFMDEVNSGNSSGSGTSSETAAAGEMESENGALNNMSELLQQLPFKRGLSKHFQGKSQSFTSLANVTCLEDLAKPENPYNKKIKSCKSYMGLKELAPHEANYKSASSSRLVSKKTSSTKASCSSINAKRGATFLGMGANKPPPHRSQSTSNFANHQGLPLFA